MGSGFQKAYHTSGRLLNKNKYSFIILIAVVAIALLFYRKVKGFLFPDSEEEKQDKRQAEQKAKELEYIHVKGALTKPLVFYKNAADSLQSALDNILMFNVVKEINDILLPLNDSELIQVYKEFGLRYYDSSWWNPQKSGKYDLFKWFQLRLFGSDLDNVKKIYSKTNLWK